MASDHPTPNALLGLHFGEQAEEETKAVAAHAAGCPECRTALEDLEWLEGSLAEIPEETPPPGGLERVLERVSQEAPRLGRRDGWLLPVVASLGGMAVAASVVYGAGTWILSCLAPLVPGAARAPLAESGLVLAVLTLVGVASLVTLALAPPLLLESRTRRRRLAAG